MNSKMKKVVILLLVIIVVLFGALTLYKFVLNDNNNDKEENYDINNEVVVMEYEIKENGTLKELYVNNKKIEELSVNKETGNIEVVEFNDLLIVDKNDNSLRSLFYIDKNVKLNEFNYRAKYNDKDFVDSIYSFKVEKDTLYITVSRKLSKSDFDWFCEYKDKNVITEYEVKFKYNNGKFLEKEVINELSVASKYKDIDCNTFSYETKENGTLKELYIYETKVPDGSLDNESGNINAENVKDVIFVDEAEFNQSKRLIIVNKKGEIKEIDYSIDMYNNDLSNSISSYKIDGNYLYVNVSRKLNDNKTWYCDYENKDEVVEYELRYEYLGGNFVNKTVLKEIKVKDKTC